MKTLLLVLLLTLSTCSNKINYYHGYIYYNNKPLEGLKVTSQFDININSITNKKGYFKITDEKALGGDLIVYDKNKPIDTIVTMWSQHGEKMVYSFISGKNDTLKIKKVNLIK